MNNRISPLPIFVEGNPNPAPPHAAAAPPPSRRSYEIKNKEIQPVIDALLIALIVASSVTALVLFLIQRISPKFHLESLSISPFNISGEILPTVVTWNIGVAAINPNKDRSINYKSIRVSIESVFGLKVDGYSGKVTNYRQNPDSTDLLNVRIDSVPGFGPGKVNGTEFFIFDLRISVEYQELGKLISSRAYHCGALMVKISSNSTETSWDGEPDERKLIDSSTWVSRKKCFPY